MVTTPFIAMIACVLLSLPELAVTAASGHGSVHPTNRPMALGLDDELDGHELDEQGETMHRKGQEVKSDKNSDSLIDSSRLVRREGQQEHAASKIQVHTHIDANRSTQHPCAQACANAGIDCDANPAASECAHCNRCVLEVEFAHTCSSVCSDPTNNCGSNMNWVSNTGCKHCKLCMDAVLSNRCASFCKTGECDRFESLSKPECSQCSACISAQRRNSALMIPGSPEWLSCDYSYTYTCGSATDATQQGCCCELSASWYETEQACMPHEHALHPCRLACNSTCSSPSSLTDPQCASCVSCWQDTSRSYWIQEYRHKDVCDPFCDHGRCYASDKIGTTACLKCSECHQSAPYPCDAECKPPNAPHGCGLPGNKTMAGCDNCTNCWAMNDVLNTHFCDKQCPQYACETVDDLVNESNNETCAQCRLCWRDTLPHPCHGVCQDSDCYKTSAADVFTDTPKCKPCKTCLQQIAKHPCGRECPPGVCNYDSITRSNLACAACKSCVSGNGNSNHPCASQCTNNCADPTKIDLPSCASCKACTDALMIPSCVDECALGQCDTSADLQLEKCKDCRTCLNISLMPGPVEALKSWSESHPCFTSCRWYQAGSLTGSVTDCQTKESWLTPECSMCGECVEAVILHPCSDKCDERCSLPSDLTKSECADCKTCVDSETGAANTSSCKMACSSNPSSRECKACGRALQTHMCDEVCPVPNCTLANLDDTECLGCEKCARVMTGAPPDRDQTLQCSGLCSDVCAAKCGGADCQTTDDMGSSVCEPCKGCLTSLLVHPCYKVCSPGACDAEDDFLNPECKACQYCVESMAIPFDSIVSGGCEQVTKDHKAPAAGVLRRGNVTEHGQEFLIKDKSFPFAGFFCPATVLGCAPVGPGNKTAFDGIYFASNQGGGENVSAGFDILSKGTFCPKVPPSCAACAGGCITNGGCTMTLPNGGGDMTQAYCDAGGYVFCPVSSTATTATTPVVVGQMKLEVPNADAFAQDPRAVRALKDAIATTSSVQADQVELSIVVETSLLEVEAAQVNRTKLTVDYTIKIFSGDDAAAVASSMSTATADSLTTAVGTAMPEDLKTTYTVTVTENVCLETADVVPGNLQYNVLVELVMKTKNGDAFAKDETVKQAYLVVMKELTAVPISSIFIEKFDALPCAASFLEGDRSSSSRQRLIRRDSKIDDAQVSDPTATTETTTSVTTTTVTTVTTATTVTTTTVTENSTTAGDSGASQGTQTDNTTNANASGPCINTVNIEFFFALYESQSKAQEQADDVTQKGVAEIQRLMNIHIPAVSQVAYEMTIESLNATVVQRKAQEMTPSQGGLGAKPGLLAILCSVFAFVLMLQRSAMK